MFLFLPFSCPFFGYVSRMTLSKFCCLWYSLAHTHIWNASLYIPFRVDMLDRSNYPRSIPIYPIMLILEIIRTLSFPIPIPIIDYNPLFAPIPFHLYTSHGDYWNLIESNRKHWRRLGEIRWNGLGRMRWMNNSNKEKLPVLLCLRNRQWE